MPDPRPGIFGRARRRLTGVAKWVSRIAAGMAVAGALGFGLLAALYPEGAPMPDVVLMHALGSMGALVLSPVIGLAGRLLRVGGLRREGQLVVDGRGLVLVSEDGTARVLAQRVESGVIVPKDGRFDVQLRAASGNAVSVIVEDEASAEALLDLVGVERRTKARWAKLGARLGAGALGAFGGLVAGMTILLNVPEPLTVLGAVAFLTLPFLVPGPLSTLLAWRELEVGADGIAWRYWLRRKVLPLAEVQGVAARHGQLIVRLADGTDRRFEIPTDGLAEGLARRIEDALARMGGARAKAPLFARGELAFAEWVQRMKGLLGRDTAFRAAPVVVDDAVRVLEDAEADPDARVGAAVALSQLAEPALAARVRVVAESCVSPKLRVALEDAARDALDEEVVEAARAELRHERAGATR